MLEKFWDYDDYVGAGIFSEIQGFPPDSNWNAAKWRAVYSIRFAAYTVTPALETLG